MKHSSGRCLIVNQARNPQRGVLDRQSAFSAKARMDECIGLFSTSELCERGRSAKPPQARRDYLPLSPLLRGRVFHLGFRTPRSAWSTSCLPYCSVTAGWRSKSRRYIGATIASSSSSGSVVAKKLARLHSTLDVLHGRSSPWTNVAFVKFLEDRWIALSFSDQVCDNFAEQAIALDGKVLNPCPQCLFRCRICRRFEDGTEPLMEHGHNQAGLRWPPLVQRRLSNLRASCDGIHG